MWLFPRFLVALYSIYPYIHTVKTLMANFGSDGCGFEILPGALIILDKFELIPNIPPCRSIKDN